MSLLDARARERASPLVVRGVTRSVGASGGPGISPISAGSGAGRGALAAVSPLVDARATVGRSVAGGDCSPSSFDRVRVVDGRLDLATAPPDVSVGGDGRVVGLRATTRRAGVPDGSTAGRASSVVGGGSLAVGVRATRGWVDRGSSVLGGGSLRGPASERAAGGASLDVDVRATAR
jgi:hypothetical protein